MTPPPSPHTGGGYHGNCHIRDVNNSFIWALIQVIFSYYQIFVMACVQTVRETILEVVISTEHIQLREVKSRKMQGD